MYARSKIQMETFWIDFYLLRPPKFATCVPGHAMLRCVLTEKRSMKANKFYPTKLSL